ncbi:ABC transporter permease [Clostridium sp. OS1-26]|uniref:ABC transporter permease n=1 Tax=Clostridium sp. OS1-26 TaxID=3070681 RepID=UPI0027DF7558|nr:ABC transporter permease [Clostridium sp. OS1-26]WML37327.1 ABC transporter permease [Clostridium sp. OS1-26]
MELLKGELLKLKRLSIFQMAILAPALVLLLGIKFYSFIKVKAPQVTPWDGLAVGSDTIFVGAILPILIMYVIIMMSRIENLNNGWKQLLVMPVKREKIYLTKYLVVLLVLAATLAAYLVEYTITAYLLGAKGIIPVEMFVNIIFIFIALQPFIAILFFLSNRFSSFVLSLGVGMVFILSSMLIVQSSYWKYDPWTYPLALIQGGLSIVTEVLPFLLISALIFISIFFLDMYNFRRRDII